MSWLQKHADELLAALTSILAAGHLGHLFSQEWIVLISALLTLAATFFTKDAAKQFIAPPAQPPQKPGGQQK